MGWVIASLSFLLGIWVGYPLWHFILCRPLKRRVKELQKRLISNGVGNDKQ